MNLLITGAWQQAAEYIETIEQSGHAVHFLQFEKDDLPCEYEWVEGIIGNGIFLSHPIELFFNLKYVQLTSAGYDRIPMDYVNMNGIMIHNARGVYSIPMAEYAVAGVLQLYKHMIEFHDNQLLHHWNKNRYLLELADKTVAIIGCGSVGTECAKRFKAFGAFVIGVDIAIRADDNYNSIKSLFEIDDVIKASDIVIITVPLTDETRGLFNAQRISNLKDGAIIVNIARGAVIQMDTLVSELQIGRISAVLDVFDTEPLSADSPLWNMENVIVTPHNSFVGEGNGKRMSQVIMSNLEKYAGHSPKE